MCSLMFTHEPMNVNDVRVAMRIWLRSFCVHEWLLAQVYKNVSWNSSMKTNRLKLFFQGYFLDFTVCREFFVLISHSVIYMKYFKTPKKIFYFLDRYEV